MASSRLTRGIRVTDTSADVSPDDAADFETGVPYRAMLGTLGTRYEFVRVLRVDGARLTIQRGLNPTWPLDWPEGTPIEREGASSGE